MMSHVMALSALTGLLFNAVFLRYDFAYPSPQELNRVAVESAAEASKVPGIPSALQQVDGAGDQTVIAVMVDQGNIGIDAA